MKKNGGRMASFDDAMKAAYEDMYNDSKKIREKRKMKRMPQMEHSIRNVPCKEIL
jgi:copper chaperone NosL